MRPNSRSGTGGRCRRAERRFTTPPGSGSESIRSASDGRPWLRVLQHLAEGAIVQLATATLQSHELGEQQLVVVRVLGRISPLQLALDDGKLSRQPQFVRPQNDGGYVPNQLIFRAAQGFHREPGDQPAMVIIRAGFGNR